MLGRRVPDIGVEQDQLGLPQAAKLTARAERRPNAFEFAKIHEICRKNSIAKGRQFLRKTIGLCRIGNLFESLRQKGAAQQGIRKNSRQVARIFFSGNFLDFGFAISRRVALIQAACRINRQCVVVIDETVCFKPAVFVVVCRLFKLDARRVTDLRHNLCPEVWVVLEKGIQDQHPNRWGFAFFERFDGETVVGREDQLRTRGRIVAIDFVDMNEVLQEQ